MKFKFGKAEQIVIAGIALVFCFIIANELSTADFQKTDTSTSISQTSLEGVDDLIELSTFSRQQIKSSIVPFTYKYETICKDFTMKNKLLRSNNNISEEAKKAKKKELTKLKKEQLNASKESKKLKVARVFEISSSLKSENRTYMHARSITNRSSNQWNLLHDGTHSIINDEKGLTVIDGRYAIALGSYFCNKIGTKIDIEFTDGTVINCILGDQKANKDTDPTHRYHWLDKSVVEFLVADDYASNNTGNINWTHNWNSKVKTISILGLEKGSNIEKISVEQQNQYANSFNSKINAAKRAIKKLTKKMTLNAYKEAKSKVNALTTSGEKTEFKEQLKDIKKKIDKKIKKEKLRKEKLKQDKKNKEKSKENNKENKETETATNKASEIETTKKPAEKVTESSTIKIQE